MWFVQRVLLDQLMVAPMELAGAGATLRKLTEVAEDQSALIHAVKAGAPYHSYRLCRQYMLPAAANGTQPHLCPRQGRKFSSN